MEISKGIQEGSQSEINIRSFYTVQKSNLLGNRNEKQKPETRKCDLKIINKNEEGLCEESYKTLLSNTEEIVSRDSFHVPNWEG